MNEAYEKARKANEFARSAREKAMSDIVRKCDNCGGWINPPWSRGDGKYRHCECKSYKK